jgi:hypothetical protein
LPTRRRPTRPNSRPGAGLIGHARLPREIDTTKSFSDGTTMSRHTFFSNFGFAHHVSMPGEATVDAPGGTCYFVADHAAPGLIGSDDDPVTSP